MVEEKMQKKVKKLMNVVVFLFFLLIFINFSYSTVEVFSKYDTVLTIDAQNNLLSVNKSLALKNVYDVGIVPGQIEFKIAKGVDGSLSNLEIVNVSAKDSFGEEIKLRTRNTDEYSVIVLDIFYPLLPGFEYEFNLNYELSYEPGGIFFKSLQIPIRESTIPIEEGVFKVVLPENYHFTYLGENSESANLEENVVFWNIKDNEPNSIAFEYSWLPVRIDGIKGSYVFWILINLILLIVLYFEIKREIKNIKSRNEDG
ncbi:MAG: hypothetical protein ACOC16_01565 [Nanoarchaeota archaeon]